jgi:hypothetical protein
MSFSRIIPTIDRFRVCGLLVLGNVIMTQRRVKSWDGSWQQLVRLVGRRASTFFTVLVKFVAKLHFPTPPIRTVLL